MFDKEINYAKEKLIDLNRYKNPRDINVKGLYERIDNCLTDLIQINKVDTIKDLIFVIVTIDSIQTCISNILRNEYGIKEFKNTDAMKYVKFIRNMLMHPDGLDDKNFKGVYAKYINNETQNVFYSDFQPNTLCTNFVNFENFDYIEYLFDNKNNDCKDNFVVKISYTYPKFKFLICPYDKLGYGLKDCLDMFYDTYTTLSDTEEIEKGVVD